jgi:hypothetical protein
MVIIPGRTLQKKENAKMASPKVIHAPVLFGLNQR